MANKKISAAYYQALEEILKSFVRKMLNLEMLKSWKTFNYNYKLHRNLLSNPRGGSLALVLRLENSKTWHKISKNLFYFEASYFKVLF